MVRAFLTDPLFMDAFLVSTGIVGLADIGDKTQLLAFLLAARFRRQLSIVLGIFVSSAWPPGPARHGNLAGRRRRVQLLTSPGQVT
jgi:hypothetical protein